MARYYLSILTVCFIISISHAQIVKYTVNPTKNPPRIDGVLDDICWSEVLSYPIDEIKLKVCYDKTYIYLAASFPAIIKSTIHRPWKWDINQNIYLPGAEQESTLTFVAGKHNSSLKDLWFWRSARTNPTGFADDFHLLSNKSGSNPILQDSGLRCWYSKYFGHFAGYEIPRFYNQHPTGSGNDVEAKGTWQNELWTIELKRKLTTGNSDDLDFSGLNDIELQIYIGRPLAEYIIQKKNLITLEFSKPTHVDTPK